MTLKPLYKPKIRFFAPFCPGILLFSDFQRLADSKKIAVFCLNYFRNAGSG